MMNSKIIFVWGAPFSVPKGEALELSLERAGLNFGNILIGNGIKSVLTGYDYLTRDDVQNPEEVNDRCDHVIIPAANFLWRDFDFGFMYDFLSKVNLPMTIVGLGAQTDNRSKIEKIHPNTLRLIQFLSERTPSLGVRGFYTAEVLSAHGINNVQVLGCPSIYTYGRSEYALQVRPRNVGKLNLSVNFSRTVASHSFSPEKLRIIENALLKLAIANDANFVAQDELHELKIHLEKDRSYLARVAEYFHSVESEAVFNFFSNKSNYFLNFSDWSKYISSFDSSIGSRLHGNIISLINNVPALTIAHDSRTLEMCALMGAPYLHVDDVDQSFTDFDMLDRFYEIDLSLFNRNYKSLVSRYVEFLNSHNLNNIFN